MSITPNEILDKEFARRFRGYDPDEVDTFLEEVAQSLADVIKEKNALKDQITLLKAQLDQHKAKEEEFQKAITAAHSVCEDMKVQAEKEAKLILEQARLDAERIVADAHQEIIELEQRIRALRRLQREAIFRVRSSLEVFMNIVEEEAQALPSEELDKMLEQAATAVKAIQAETGEESIVNDERQREDVLILKEKGSDEIRSSQQEVISESERDGGLDSSKGRLSIDPDKLWPKEASSSS